MKKEKKDENESGIQLNFVKKQIIKEHFERDPSFEEEDESSLPFRAWPTEMEFKYHDEIVKAQNVFFFAKTKQELLKEFLQHKFKLAIGKKCVKNFDEVSADLAWREKMLKEHKDIKEKMDAIAKELKFSISHTNLNIMAHKDE